MKGKIKYIAAIELDEYILRRLKSFFKKKKIAEHKNTEDYFYGFRDGVEIFVRISKIFKDLKEPLGYLIIRRKFSEEKKILRVDYLFGEYMTKKEVFDFKILKKGGGNEKRKENKIRNDGNGRKSEGVVQELVRKEENGIMDEILWSNKAK